MESETTLSEKESLELISKMILSAKTSISRDGIFYQIWGWGVFIAAIIHFLLLQIDFSYPWITWAVLMPACGVAVMLIGQSRDKKARIKTFVEEFLNYLWIAFTVSLFLVLLFMSRLGPEHVYPIIIILYGLGTFVSGSALKFMPLKIGGGICWILSVVSFYADFEYQLLLIALAVLLAYIIPGYLMRKKYKSERGEWQNDDLKIRSEETV